MNCESTLNYENNKNDTQAGINIFHYNDNLGRGINMGNALEAPNEGEWDVKIEKEYFSIIKDAGFSNIRIPIRWSVHTADEAPYNINHTFINRVDWVIGNALANDLKIIINIHHFEAIMEQPSQEKEKFFSLWRQISQHYKDFSMDICFEILNEPHDKLTPQLWNQYLVEALNIIRASNPERPVIIGTANWGGITALSELELPDDENIIFTFHYYEPFHFTHQGAEWNEGSEAWLGTSWEANDSEVNDIVEDFNLVENWANNNEIPVFLGEFGAYSKANSTSRQLWTKSVREEAEKRNFSWAYWEFCSGFGAYDDQSNKWRRYLIEALIE
ncbi:MAG: glycoside hydrolase family 5 protein [Candidatus Marinimicrobia bacterium]|nr:glycoside hydrolase family 5 protein [Candidatus Neomarinimicrobiota bacterium]